MSADLSIRINRKIRTEMFLTDIKQLFCQILGIDNSVEIIIQTISNKEWISLEDRYVGEKKQYFTIKIKGLEDGVNVSVYRIEFEPPYVTDEAGLWSNVSTGIKKSPLEIVLSAVTAIILSKENNSIIEDNGLFWSDTFEKSPKDFYDYILQDKKFQTNIKQAREYLVKNGEKILM